jgi:hypothetical protein
MVADDDVSENCQLAKIGNDLGDQWNDKGVGCYGLRWLETFWFLPRPFRRLGFPDPTG